MTSFQRDAVLLRWPSFPRKHYQFLLAGLAEGDTTGGKLVLCIPVFAGLSLRLRRQLRQYGTQGSAQRDYTGRQDRIFAHRRNLPCLPDGARAFPMVW